MKYKYKKELNYKLRKKMVSNTYYLFIEQYCKNTNDYIK